METHRLGLEDRSLPSAPGWQAQGHRRSRSIWGKVTGGKGQNHQSHPISSFSVLYFKSQCCSFWVTLPGPLKETQFRSLGQEDPLEKEVATPLVLLLGKLHGQRSLEVYSPWDLKESDITEHTHTHIFCFTSMIWNLKWSVLVWFYFHPLFWVFDGPFKSENTVLPILEKFSWIFCYFSPSYFLCSSSWNLFWMWAL